jgi:hypothetical protein
MTVKIKPGLLVSLSVRSRGGVSYQKRDLTRTVEETTETKAWETTRVISDTEEHERATKVRGLARSTVAKVCTVSSFGLLCPEADEPALDAAMAEARRIVREFNETAQFTQIGVYVMKGRVASTDAEAAAAIAGEVRDLLTEMERACKAADVEAIREAASRAKGLGDVLEGPSAYAVSEAVKAARAIARTVVKRVEKEGKTAQEALFGISTAPIEIARFMFEEGPEVVIEGPELPAVDAQRFTGIEQEDNGSTFTEASTADAPSNVPTHFIISDEVSGDEPSAPPKADFAPTVNIPTVEV